MHSIERNLDSLFLYRMIAGKIMMMLILTVKDWIMAVIFSKNRVRVRSHDFEKRLANKICFSQVSTVYAWVA